MPARILLVYDEKNATSLYQSSLDNTNYDLNVSNNYTQAIEKIRSNTLDLLVAELDFSQVNSIEFFKSSKKIQPELAILMIVTRDTINAARRIMNEALNVLIIRSDESDFDLKGIVNKILNQSNIKNDAIGLKTIKPLSLASQLLMSETTPQSLLRVIVNISMWLMQSDYAAIYLWNTEKNTFDCEVGFGQPFPWENSNEGLEWLTGFRNLKDGRSLNSDKDFPPVENDKIIVEWGVRSILLAPVLLNKNFYLFVVARKNGMNSFNNSDKEIFLVFSRQSCLSLENARFRSTINIYQQLEEDGFKQAFLEKKLEYSVIAQPNPGVYFYNDNLLLDVKTRTFIWFDQFYFLTQTETKVMEYLLKHYNQVVDKEVIVTGIYNYQVDNSEAGKILRPIMSRLRQKLARFPEGGKWIRTVRSSGYVLNFSP